MKKIQSLSTTILLALLIGVAFTSCSKDDKGPEDDGVSDSYVKIKLEDGTVIELNDPMQVTGGISPIGSFSTSLTEKDIIIIIQIPSFGEPTVGDQFTLIGVSARNVAGETYRSPVLQDNETKGEGKVTITAISDDQVKANFSVIMYTPDGKRATMEGKFTQKLKSILD